MKQRFILYKRSNGTFYCEDTQTRKQQSLKTQDEAAALTLLHSKNEAFRQPILNQQIALAYLSASDCDAGKRTWQFVMNEVTATKTDTTRNRYARAILDRAFDLIRDLPLLETRAEHFLKVIRVGTVSTNVYLRRLHNFALDMTWLPKTILPKKQWPKPVFKDKRAITAEEHARIIERELNPERRAFYELAWHTGASQSDLANLHAKDIDWQRGVVSYERMKITGRAKTPPQITIGIELEKLLRTLPSDGHVFPYLRTVRAGDRATEFRQRCHGLGIAGVTLHSYRYSWAERAKKAGYPERWAQVALGHNSKAWARYYSKGAEVVLPPLEDYEKKIIPLRQPNGATAAVAPIAKTA